MHNFCFLCIFVLSFFIFIFLSFILCVFEKVEVKKKEVILINKYNL